MQFGYWADPTFDKGNPDRDGLGYFSSLALRMGLAVGAAASLFRSYSRSAVRIGTGLVLGFALAGIARHVSLLGVWHHTSDVALNWVIGGVLALIGCLLLAAVAIRRIAADREERAAPGGTGVLPRVLVIVGAGLLVAGTIVPYNDAPGVKIQSLIGYNDGWDASEAIAISVFAVAVSLVLSRGPEVASGALIALGTFATLLCAGRYVGFVAWRFSDLPAPGAFLALGGAAAILAGGFLARPHRVHVSVASGLPAGGAT